MFYNEIKLIGKRRAFVFSKDFSCKIKSPLSIKKRNKIGILRFFDFFFQKYEI